MRLTNKKIQETVGLLDSIIEKYKEDKIEKKRDWRTYEQRFAYRSQTIFKELKPLIYEATSNIKIIKFEQKGSKPLLTLEQKVLALLLKHLIDKSNRDMSAMIVLFSWLSGISISYKTIERLYSDEQVILVLHNLNQLMLKKKEIKKADCSGDGTGYSLSIKTHYASEAQKLKDKAKQNYSNKGYKKIKTVYSFALMDIKSKMYLGFGSSLKSEKEAYYNAFNMVKETGISIRSIRLDRYYSFPSVVNFLSNSFGEINFFLIPKKNSTLKGSFKWKQMLSSFVENTPNFLNEYYKRNYSEGGFSEDKKRTGWKVGQKREDRIDTSIRLTGIWHNLYNL